MSTNPNDIVRVRARANGRASVYEANAWCQSLSQGVLDGNGVIQNTSADMNVLVGGTSSKPDVVIASNPSGYKIALDIVGQQAVAITAPASNKRITSIVAYTDDLSLASTDENITGSPSSCGLIVVNGTASASPSAPDDATIRTAITADGATGSQACYCVLAEILVDHTTTTITNSLIDNKISGVNQIADLAVKSNSIDWTTTAAYNTNTSNITIPTSYVDVVSVDVSHIPNGKKMFIYTSARLSWDHTDETFHWDMTDQNNNVLPGQEGYITSAHWGFIATLAKVVEKTADLTTVKLIMKKQDPVGSPKIDSGYALIVVRVIG